MIGPEAQLSENKIESIANQTNASTSPQINVGNSPIYISYLGNTSITEDSVYVANSGSNTVSVISPAITTVKNIAVGNRPFSIATHPFADSVYVANSGSNTVSVIDLANNTVIKNIAVGNYPVSIAIFPFRHSNTNTVLQFDLYAYVANSGSNTVSVIDPANNTVIKNIAVGNYPVSIAILP